MQTPFTAHVEHYSANRIDPHSVWLQQLTAWRGHNCGVVALERSWLTGALTFLYRADKTKAFALAIGLKPLTTPVCSPQSNGMAESFVNLTDDRHLNHPPTKARPLCCYPAIPEPNAAASFICTFA